jgi:hypothetical protein
LEGGAWGIWRVRIGAEDEVVDEMMMRESWKNGY